MPSSQSRPRSRVQRRPVAPAVALARACHLGPTVAVTGLTALLAHTAGHRVGSGALVVAAVFTGQLGIGWSNDLIDRPRDQAVGRTDKPLARGEVGVGTVRTAVTLSLLVCVGLSLALGPQAGAVHLLLGVAMGWAYNLGLKATLASPLPYAVAFGSLPAVVWLALPGDGWWSTRAWPPVWVMVAGGLLGVGAHLVNVLPDLADDAATGVRGLPHALGERWVRPLAAAVLLGAVAVTTVGAGRLGPVPWLLLAGCVGLAAVVIRGRGRTPFAAAVAIAAVVVLGLAVRR